MTDTTQTDPEAFVEAIALTILNSDRKASGWPPVESREGIPDSEGYVRNARAIIAALPKLAVELHWPAYHAGMERAAEIAEDCHVEVTLAVGMPNGAQSARRQIIEAIRNEMGGD